MMSHTFQLGLDTFGDVTSDAHGNLKSHAQALRDVIAEAVTVLSTDDPVRVFERFSTQNAVSGGRAEVILGRANTARLLDLSRFNMKYSNGTLQHEKLMRSIELFGTRVAPRVRELLRGAKPESDATSQKER